MTDTTPELVGGKYSRSVIDNVCSAWKIPMLNDKQWKMLIDWCEDTSPDDISDEIDYFIENLDKIELDIDEYNESYLRIHGKTWEKMNGKTNND